jgi:transposase InsO family protein
MPFPIKTLLADNGREFCSRPCGLFLQLGGIDRRKAKVRRPQSNGLVERFHRTLPLPLAPAPAPAPAAEQLL